MTRSRATVLFGIVGVSALAWAYVIWLSRAMDMSGVSPGADMSGMIMPAFKHWSIAEAGFMFVMWAVMMVAMMLPSAAPMILLYERVGRSAAQQGHTFAAPGWFAAGYLLAWALFAFAATVFQWACEQVALLTPDMAASSRIVGGIVLFAAGLYQWTRFKDACLARCQAPLAFIQRHGGFRADGSGAVMLGFRHGTYCVGCCWALMALLFVGGVMNLLWIAGLAAFVLLEKSLPVNRVVSRTAGAALIAAGAFLVFSGSS